MKISVIIPVYNVEAYLPECIDSVLNQTYADYEIILVDDGSTDKSGEICDSYALRDSRIRVIHKENGGLSDARNCGFNETTGDCVIFLDSDDFLSDTALEEASSIIKKEDCDFVFFDALSFNDEGRDYSIKQNYIRKFDYPPADGLTVLLNQLKNKEYHSSACMMLIKTDFLRKNNVCFFKGILYEDMLFTYELYARAKKVFQLKKAVYHRRYRQQSIMTSRLRARNFRSAETVFEKACDLSDKIDIADSESSRLYLAKCAYNAMNIYKRMEMSEQREETDGYKSVKELCKKHSCFGDKALKMRCRGKFFWFIYKVFTKLLKVK